MSIQTLTHLVSSPERATPHPLLEQTLFDDDDGLIDEKPFIISLDSEHQLSQDGKRNHVISYQYYASPLEHYEDYGDYEANGKVVKGIIYTERKKNGVEKRLTFNQFLRHVLLHARSSGVIKYYPKHVYIIAHFLRADVGSFLDFFQEKMAVKGMRKTVTSIDKSYGIDADELLGKRLERQVVTIYDAQRNHKVIHVRFVDTQLLSPNQSGLAAIGDIVELEKLTIPEGYSIERMQEYLEGDPQGFEAYAMRDAEIVHKYIMHFFHFMNGEFMPKGGRKTSRLPVTLASLAVKLFQASCKENNINLHAFLGMKETKRKAYNPNTGRYRTKKALQPDDSMSILEQMAIRCYYGGRNEAFVCGYTPKGDYYDFDLPSAYTTAMLGIHPLDFDRYQQVNDINAFKGHVFGLAHIQFEFPEGTRIPSLPVATEHGLIYPLSGKTYCTAVEIENALNQGCKIQLLNGFIIPWKNTTERPFKEFVKLVRQKRKSYAKGSLHELLWKEIGNSLYGKVAQGLGNKTTFDVQAGRNKPVPRSLVTCAYYAAYITGFIRAVVSELLNALPPDKWAISVTTDGFLTNASAAEIKMDGVISSRYKSLLNIMDEMVVNKEGNKPDTPVLEEKHYVKQLCCMKTRGQFTLMAGDKGDPHSESNIVLAKAGVQVPENVRGKFHDKALRKSRENDYMASLYFNRVPNQTHSYNTLTSIRDSYINERDLIRQIREVRLNLDFDMKRCLTEVETMEVNGIPRLFMQTKPWKTVEEFLQARTLFDTWRKTSVLKTPEDYTAWRDFYLQSCAVQGKRIRRGKEGSHQILLRQFLRCYAQEQYGVKRLYSYKELIQRFAQQGIVISETQLKNAGRQNAKLKLQCVANTEVNLKLLAFLLEIMPTFEYEAFFTEPINQVDLLPF